MSEVETCSGKQQNSNILQKPKMCRHVLKADQWSLSWARLIQNTYKMLFFKYLCQKGFVTKILVYF
jgi:hypothetical protein